MICTSLLLFISTVTNVQKSTKSNWAPNLARYKTGRVWQFTTKLRRPLLNRKNIYTYMTCVAKYILTRHQLTNPGQEYLTDRNKLFSFWKLLSQSSFSGLMLWYIAQQSRKLWQFKVICVVWGKFMLSSFNCL